MGQSRGPFPWVLLAIYAVPIGIVLTVLILVSMKGP